MAALKVILSVLVALEAGTFVPWLSFYSRTILAFLALAVCAAYGVVASIALRCVGHPGLSQWTTARAFKWVMLIVAGVTFDVEGTEHLEERPAVLISNHQTELDVLMLGCVFPKYTSVTAKKSLMYTPFLGWFMALSQTVFIDRANSASARSAFDSAAAHMTSARQNVFIFPEGTRSYFQVPDMLPFKKGAFHLAVQAGVPIIPIVCANYSNVLSMQRKWFARGRIRVKVLPAVATRGLNAEDVAGLTDRVRGDMLRVLEDLTDDARAKGTAMQKDDALNAQRVGKGSGQPVNAKASGLDKRAAKTKDGL